MTGWLVLAFSMNLILIVGWCCEMAQAWVVAKPVDWSGELAPSKYRWYIRAARDDQPHEVWDMRTKPTRFALAA